MANVKNNHTGPIGVGGVTIRPGATAFVPNWSRWSRSGAVKLMIARNVLTVEGGERPKSDMQLPPPAVDPLTGLPIVPQAGDEEAQKLALIKTLEERGITKTTRSSLESLKKAVEDSNPS